MTTEEFISLNQLSEYYEIEISFFSGLSEIGLIEIQTIEQVPHIHRDTISEIEKMIRMHRELNINAEGIDTVLNLLEQIDELQRELTIARNRLSLYED
ncbi:MAG: chaperone modulator CbpM [Bacteroidota bacterium]|nr:chaperone modulator CbpM [Bacteroidota bacterium]